MKKIWGTRVLAMLLVLALAVGLMPTVLASESKESVTFKQVSNDMLERSIRPDLCCLTYKGLF